MKKVTSLLLMLGLVTTLGLSSCGNGDTTSSATSESSITASSIDESSASEESSSSEEDVAVKEVILELSKVSAKIGDKVTATVKVKPTNATDKEFTLTSSDTNLATISGSEITCVAAGVVTITARSKSAVTKKSEVKLTILGKDAEGRSENVFEAESGTLVPVSGSGMKTEVASDTRVSGTSVVGSLSTGDRIIWGITSSAADTDCVMKLNMMGPSGWVTNWDSIACNFADFYTVKVNGKVIDTESIKFEGTTNQSSSADYYNIKEITIGKIALKEGLNTVTLVLSNRFNQSTVDDGTYKGTISCYGNIDSLNIFSKSDLTLEESATETDNADDDVTYITDKFEVEASTTRIYESEETPKADIGTATSVDFITNMNVMFGVETEAALKTRISFRLSAPYKAEGQAVETVNFKDLFNLDIGGKNVDTSSINIKAFDTASKENYVEVTTDWVDLAAGQSVINFSVKKVTGYAYLGGMDYMALKYIKGTTTAFLNDKPAPSTTFKYEAEADNTARVGLGTLAEGATSVELKPQSKVQTDVYNNKTVSPKVIYGIESDRECYATVTMKLATPYIDEATAVDDISIGNLGDLWVNGKMVSTPEKLTGTTTLGKKDNFTEVEISAQIELDEGKNRIAWEPYNYTDSTYAYYGAMDYITLTTSASLTDYKVNIWTDRNSYFDDGNNEPINVTCSEVPDSHYWVGLYKEEDTVQTKQPGSIYWYYPTAGVEFNLMGQNPNSERGLINADNGGFYKVVYMSYDYTNAEGGYDVYDVVHISCWNDNSLYGGLVK